ncbi:hypothetical protein FC83_GL001885 [Agrilactobacillus composti DSM 18527 = JCM 14202]|uniref:Surface layer protein A domain-containing protein n=1 Tax=Agrilactobacillus composti DSM 18527 = JCM 14202 TaxID=1423734 RepID=X0PDK9_9LACO|nr:hypothetical protein [Agrilactobacillus composti]KRM35037.1 hypothetical protein FC83_GL001885 [Agrilactobacillus composti DSM 18527 = JCM 14202]GAF39254.1 hypothetical protein JCM14202_1104 [Agrilactobacillus composti DSM 18527 = JCM 14202]
MRKKILGFILLVASALLFALIPAKSVSAADDEVVFPIRDSSFLALTDASYPKFLAHTTNYFDTEPTDSYVPGLSVWKVSNAYKGNWFIPSVSTNNDYYTIGYADESYEVGPNLFLNNKQAIKIPVGEVTFKGLGMYHGIGFTSDLPWTMVYRSDYIATVQNSGPVALWQSPAYQTPTQWVDPGDSFTLNQVYFSYDSGLWFDIGANQWIPAYYLDSTLTRNR